MGASCLIFAGELGMATCSAVLDIYKRSIPSTGTRGQIMKAILLALPIILSAIAASAQDIVPLEIVRLEKVQIEGMPAGLSPT
jgi:hypothetical protein